MFEEMSDNSTWNYLLRNRVPQDMDGANGAIYRTWAALCASSQAA